MKKFHLMALLTIFASCKTSVVNEIPSGEFRRFDPQDKIRSGIPLTVLMINVLSATNAQVAVGTFDPQRRNFNPRVYLRERCNPGEATYLLKSYDADPNGLTPVMFSFRFAPPKASEYEADFVEFQTFTNNVI